MAAEITEHVYIGDDNSIDIGFTVNGAVWSTAISRVVLKLYDSVNLGDPPLVIDSDDDAQVEAFDYSNPARLVLSLGNLPILADKGNKTYYGEIRYYNDEGKKIRVTSVKGSSDLPSLKLTIHNVV